MTWVSRFFSYINYIREKNNPSKLNASTKQLIIVLPKLMHKISITKSYCNHFISMLCSGYSREQSDVAAERAQEGTLASEAFRV